MEITMEHLFAVVLLWTSIDIGQTIAEEILYFIKWIKEKKKKNDK